VIACLFEMGKKKHPLAKAMEVVEKLMKMPYAVQLFNEPVDPIKLGLTDYFDVIKRPMDLGTVRSKLLQGQEAGWKPGEGYSSVNKVLDDINLVWDNCIKYNSGPQDRTVAGAAQEMARKTRELWVKAALPGVQGAPQPAVPRPAQVAITLEKAIPATYDTPGASAWLRMIWRPAWVAASPEEHLHAHDRPRDTGARLDRCAHLARCIRRSESPKLTLCSSYCIFDGLPLTLVRLLTLFYSSMQCRTCKTASRCVYWINLPSSPWKKARESSGALT
jgi:Bromodomain